MSLAGDHSTGGVIIGGSLKTAGLGGGIVRYACAGRGDVNITPAEIRDLQANGIPIGIVCEHEADWLLRPNVAGRVAGSRDITRACGLPDGVIFLAADFDATNGGPTSPGSRGDRNMQGIAAALGAAAAVIGRQNVGFYGSFFAIQWLVAHGWGDIKFWQTEAWSMMGFGRTRNRHPKAGLFQRATSISVHGVSVDVDEIWRRDWGQRVDAVPSSPVTFGPPSPPQRASGVFKAELTYDHDRKTVELKPLQGDVKSWGDVDEWIRLEADLKVGPHKPGEWSGRVVGTK